jgi:hypothetical protein
MTQSDRPLPTPPRSRFGRDSREDTGPAAPLTSDRLAQAAAEGRLEEFLQNEIPQGDHARNLAMMMMGMSGMMPMETPAGSTPTLAPQRPGAPPAEGDAPPEVPPDVYAAIQNGDVANLMGILMAEHAKRTGLGPEPDGPLQSPAASAADRQAVPSPDLAAAPATATADGIRPGIDAAIIDELIRIGTDNGLTVDWLMLRAVKLYVEEYRKTGRL